MALDDLPPQPPLRFPQGQAYAERVLEKSRPVLLSHRRLLDQAYGPDYWQKVDVFLPENLRGASLPILIFAHGGSWIAGYKEWMAFMAPAVTALPAVFVSVSYRLAPAIKFPGPFDDCVSAVAWVYEHAEAIGGDRSRLYVGGHSAGAHLMALVALRGDALMARGLPHDVVKGCIAASAPFDLRLSDPGQTTENHRTLLADLLDAEAASPIVHVSPAAPPFLISVGEFDFPPLREQAERMRQALSAASGSVVLQDLKDHDHFDTSERSVEPGHPWLAQVARLLGLS
ncbi:alpha/beta hydrolase [Bradyrhizobium erythrophlei]|uniref:Acetyl esterase/lipase n=1 Tax=Bradyrhizobium erythrophlei TaxID=1437360 RepID=A0A1H4Z192_9BRAD|nr:alpha/beta hydrolase [Bradyrhizobium erythrophlei]SED23727.1 Acetyl esterase/lipase [Bradyrhizobium erythrophlei]